MPDDLRAYVDGPLLVDLWSELMVGRSVVVGVAGLVHGKEKNARPRWQRSESQGFARGDDAMMALVNVDLRLGVLWVCSYSQVVDGFWIMNGMFESLAGDAGDDQIGCAVLRARRAAQVEIPTPPRSGPSPFLPVLNAARVGSYLQYLKGVRSVSLEFDVEGIRAIPQRNAGRGGLVPILDAVINVGLVDAVTVGAAVRRALAVL